MLPRPRFGLYWLWPKFDIHVAYWSQSCRLCDGRRVLTLHEACPF